MKNKKGFTLVELLATITILAIITTIAIVSVSSIIESSRASTTVDTLINTFDGFKAVSSIDGRIKDGDYFYLSKSMFDSGALEYAWGGKIKLLNLGEDNYYQKIDGQKPSCNNEAQASFIYMKNNEFYICLIVNDGSKVSTINKGEKELKNNKYNNRDSLEN